MSLDISALFAEMLKANLDGEVTEKVTGDLSSMFSDMMSAGALPDISDDETHSLAEPEKARSKRRYKREQKRRLDEIAVLDFETDPFNNELEEIVYPFLCVLYTQQNDPIVIWENDHARLIEKVIVAIETLPGAYTIYAHNGGRFDYKFLMHKLRGDIKFKGSSIMKANIGKHELRDSLHILPTSLASLKKDEFDYQKMHRDIREKHKAEIIQYCINDCKYALEFIKFFIEKHGFKISIGQAAFAQVKSLYPQIENLGKAQDGLFRQFFFGGRVECFEGVCHVKGDLKYIDLNSAYPAVMANMRHPIGKGWIEDDEIGKDTFFVELTCHSKGALILREKVNGELKTSAPWGTRRFFTTIHEYKVALELGLISEITIHKAYHCFNSTTFSDFVVPLYNTRREITAAMKNMNTDSDEWNHANKNQTVIKFELNNAYGKFAQNPERYKETFLTDSGNEPEPDDKGEWECVVQNNDYWLWERPNIEFRYNNVATGASITGAQRAVLLRAINTVKRPIYCDTDSIICEDTNGLELHDTKLGAWKIESELDEIIVNGKKLYAYHTPKKDKWSIRSKGASNLTLDDMLAINRGENIYRKQTGVTLTNDGQQYYTGRTVRSTAISERIRGNG